MEKSTSQTRLSYLEELELLLRNLKVTKTSFVFYDQIFEIPDTVGQKNLDGNNLTAAFATYLYQLVHCRQTITSENTTSNQDRFDVENRNRIFVELLSQANSSIGHWEPGWTISKLEKNGKIAIKKNDLTLWVMPSQFALMHSNHGYPHIGDRGYVAMVKEFRELLPGYYMANGNTPIEEYSSITRIYWNISSDGAISLLKSLTSELNENNISFQFKILKNESHYTRADAGVLYLNKGDILKARNALSAIYHNIKTYLKLSVPLFAKRLASGISLAEDPANGESFGQNRTRLFAEAICNFHVRDTSRLEEKLRYIKSYFKTHDIDFNKPYLKNANSEDKYDEMLTGVFE